MEYCEPLQLWLLSKILIFGCCCCCQLDRMLAFKLQLIMIVSTFWLLLKPHKVGSVALPGCAHCVLSALLALVLAVHDAIWYVHSWHWLCEVCVRMRCIRHAQGSRI